MSLDLGQVQAFVAAADCLHFGRAAAQLHLTQQGLSHRIARLEQALGEPLFVRGVGAVRLTHAGKRFLPRARELLATARIAMDEVRERARPLRVDVWGQVHAPLRWIRELSASLVGLEIEISMRRNTVSAVDALLRGEIDVAFGRLPDGAGLPAMVGRRIVCLSPQGLLVDASHPLAFAQVTTPLEIAPHGLWCPSRSNPPEVADFIRHFAADFRIPIDETGANLGLDQLLTDLRHRPDRAALLPLGIPLQPDDQLRWVTLADPTPMFAWSMFWRGDDDDVSLGRLRQGLAELGRSESWPTWDPARHWLPGRDTSEVPV